MVNANPCTSAAPFSSWHRMHGQAIHEWGFPTWIPWWDATLWQPWLRVRIADGIAPWLRR